MSEHVELSEKAKEEFTAVIESLKSRIAKLAEDAIGDLYCDLPRHLETDAWLNYREALRRSARSEATEDVLSPESLWGRNVRETILKEHKERLIACLNQDLLQQVADLETTIEYLRNRSIF